MQLFSVPQAAPPPSAAELPVSVQLFSVPEYAPPPDERAELPVSTQLVTTALAESHHTPPPLRSRCVSPVLLRGPLVRVKPDNTAPSVR